MINVKNLELKNIGILEKIDMLITTQLYCGCGNFELNCPVNEISLGLLREDNILCIDDFAGIIEHVDFQDDFEGSIYAKVIGSELKSILNRRIVWGTYSARCTVEQYLRQIVKDNFITPANSMRKINLIELGPISGVSNIVEKQVTGNVILDVCVELAETFDIGFNLKISNKKLAFTVYKGVDRGIEFSSLMENVAVQDLGIGCAGYKNTCLIAGEDKDVNRVKKSIESGSGFNRREMFVDARDLQKEEGVTDSQYEALLLQRGNEKLSEHKRTEVFDSEVNETNVKYGVDFFLGDMVTTANYTLGFKKKERIYGVEKIYQGGNRTVNIIFGKE